MAQKQIDIRNEEHCLITDDSQCLVWRNKQLSYIGQECRCLPKNLGKAYGKEAIRLDLSFNAIKFLDGMESFLVLEELILDNNLLDDETKFSRNSKLRVLSLNKNKLANLDRLLDQISSCFPRLEFLSLLGNPLCPDQLNISEMVDENDYIRYRHYVLYRLPKLRFLDSQKVTTGERKEAVNRGSFLKVIRPSFDLLIFNDTPTLENPSISPLPYEADNLGTHKTVFGRLKHRYNGKHSEGNRFIRNHDL